VESRAKEQHGMAGKGDLRKRFTPHRDAPPPPPEDAGADYTRLSAELADNVGKTMKAATELGLVVAEAVGLKVIELITPARPATGARVRSTAASVFANAREKLPGVSGQTASKLTDLVVSSGFAALRAVRQSVDSARRPR
jgi:hypothetical protein